jgi:hypothetical protein
VGSMRAPIYMPNISAAVVDGNAPASLIVWSEVRVTQFNANGEFPGFR